jgi:hypothetical protein
LESSGFAWENHDVVPQDGEDLAGQTSAVANVLYIRLYAVMKDENRQSRAVGKR